MFERIEKRYLGYHVALYACEMGELGDLFLGHYKIFAKRPRSFWDRGHLAADTVGALSGSAQQALDHAQDLAEQKVRSLVSSEPFGPAPGRRHGRSATIRVQSGNAFAPLRPISCDAR